MTARYVLAPQAARDLVQIWRYVKREASLDTADRVESIIRAKCVYLAKFPHAGHGGAIQPLPMCDSFPYIPT